VTAAAIGAICGAVIVLGRRSIIDIPTALMAAASLWAIWRFKAKEPLVVVACGLLGLLVKRALLLG
jgi:chromate transporter